VDTQRAAKTMHREDDLSGRIVWSIEILPCNLTLELSGGAAVRLELLEVTRLSGTPILMLWKWLIHLAEYVARDRIYNFFDVALGNVINKLINFDEATKRHVP
jgi:hypothetical protein